MNIAKLRSMAGSCACALFIVFSAAAQAADVNQLDSGISIESWLSEGGRDLPVLSFDDADVSDEIFADIRAENIVQDKDGSTRFQLTHSGPMSRQVFANVHRVEQDDGFTRSIITNIADGQQTEFLTRTDGLAKLKIPENTDGSNSYAKLEMSGDQNTECPVCIVVGGFLITEAVCAATSALAYRQCRVNCVVNGGVQYFNSGICGQIFSECLCWIAPRRREAWEI